MRDGRGEGGVAPDRAGGVEAAYEADPYEYGDVRRLMEELELAEPIAITLVRRGHRTPERARSFLEAGVRHDTSEFEGIDEAVELIRLALDAGSRITVHGDYDVDGIAATAILVSTLRRAGGDCDWLIPDRSADGYGLSVATVSELAERGTELLITADCGITSVEEVALARELGLETIVTDHHRPGDRLPACSIVHPGVSGYPFGGLCGAAVAHKLAGRLEEAAPGSGRDSGGSSDLDLVALATIADMVPLVDENRTLAREGIAELRRARRPGIRALLEAAGVEPEHLDEGDIAFRVAPRINAAGRLYRADAGVELMITEDAERAAEIATELNAANGERREVEREVSRAAAAVLRELPEELREAPGLVLAGDGWHPGVVGIAASRIVERTGRPAVLLSIGDDGRAKGSGRGIPGFDLLAALAGCSGLLDRYGGHRAAAGVELDASRIDEFRAAFARAAAAQMPGGPPAPIERIDAVVGAEALDHDLAEQLDDLGPFGQGNPGVRLLVPWARVGDLRPMGEGGRHARFSVSSGPAKASGVAFNASGALGEAQRAPSDLTVRLEMNRWNGTVEPRAVLESARPGRPIPDAGADVSAAPPCACATVSDPAERWSELFEAELVTEPAPPPPAAPSGPAGEGGRRRLSHPRRSAVALIGELLSSGARVLVLCADARRRAGLATLAAGPDRFGGSHAVICGACPSAASEQACGEDGASLVLGDWDALTLRPRMPDGFRHVVCVDPPPEIPIAELLGATGEGYLHMALAGAGELPERSWAERWQPRPLLAEIYRSAVAEPDGITVAALAEAASGHRDPAITARCVRVLTELGIAELGGSPGARTLRIVSSEGTELERSEAWRAYTACYEDGVRYLQSQKVS